MKKSHLRYYFGQDSVLMVSLILQISQKKMMRSAFFSVFAAVRLLVNNENEKLENENE